jgi:hypothetical protein
MFARELTETGAKLRFDSLLFDDESATVQGVDSGLSGLAGEFKRFSIAVNTHESRSRITLPVGSKVRVTNRQ